MTRKISQKIIVLFVAIVVAMTFVLAFSSPGVAYADKSFGGQEYDELWFYNSLNIDQAKQVIATWDLSKVTSPIVIACIDTGITAGHEVFENVLTTNANGDLLGYNSYDAIYSGVTDTMNISDELDNHGTKVAGIMAMLIKELGLENYIKIYPIKASTIKSKDGKQQAVIQLDAAMNAIEWAISDKVNASVINLSCSSLDTESKPTEWKTNSDFLYLLSKATQTAVVVAAAGNNSADSKNNASYPAAHEEVVGVMGYNKSKGVYSTSNYGAYDLIAPADEIYTASSGKSTYDTLSGTSASTPFVSVAAALLKLRYIVEGRYTITDGVQSPSGIGFETMLFNLASAKIAKGASYSFKTLDLGVVLTQNFSEMEYDYSLPTGITFTHDGTLGTDDYHDSVYMLANEIKPVSFVAKINPFGKVNPALYETILWYVAEIKVGAVEDVKLSENYVGNGAEYSFVAPHGGDYEVIARLENPYDEEPFEVKQRVHVEYLPYYAGEVRVTTADHSGDNVDDAPSTSTIYANQNIEIGLTGIEYVDKTVEIKWFVNGEEVKSETGETYLGEKLLFAPNKAGTYVISAQYGNRAEITGEYTFTLIVKPTMSNPTYISLIVVGGVLLAGGITAAITIPVLKKKKALKNKEQQEAQKEE